MNSVFHVRFFRIFLFCFLVCIGTPYAVAEAFIPASRCVSALRASLENPAYLNSYPEDVARETYQRIKNPTNSVNGAPLLSVVIPAYREANRLPGSLRKIHEFLENFPLSVEILVIVEKSPDNTLELARKVASEWPQFKIVDNVVQQGKGYAVRSGMKQASGEYILFMDADLATPLPEILNFVEHFQQNPDVDMIIGDRNNVNTNHIRGRSVLRKAFSFGFSTMVKNLAQLPAGMDDTQCGFKAFKREVAQNIFAQQEENKFAFDLEVLLLAQAMNYNITALPVMWQDVAGSTVHPIRDPLQMLQAILRIRHRLKEQLDGG